MKATDEWPITFDVTDAGVPVGQAGPDAVAAVVEPCPGEPDGDRLGSFFDGLWWSTTTITTVGYGDVFPVTTAGRIVGGFTMLVGISTFAIVTAKVAEFLSRRGDEEEPEPALAEE